MEYEVDVLLAKNIIQKEIQGLESLLKYSITDNFIKAVNIIERCQGKIIISGIGKSGHIGNKIAATFSSTGTISIFVHPSEASHGDLGIISKNDCILLISNSGETKEIHDIFWFAKNNHIPTISIIGRSDSFLHKHSTISLIISVPSEAFNNLSAPTVSTTMTLALGDALAGCVAQRKNFLNEQYHKYHPGGNLGMLLKKASDVMRPLNDAPLVNKDTLLKDAIIKMSEKGLGLFGIIEEQKLIGIITDGDLRRHLNSNTINQRVFDIMHLNPKSVSYDLLVSDVLEFLNDNRIVTTFVHNAKHEIIGFIQIYDINRL